jgi:hypothetical protein
MLQLFPTGTSDSYQCNEIGEKERLCHIALLSTGAGPKRPFFSADCCLCSPRPPHTNPTNFHPQSTSPFLTPDHFTRLRNDICPRYRMHLLARILSCLQLVAIRHTSFDMAWRCTGRSNVELISNLAASGLIKNDRVLRAMSGVGFYLSKYHYPLTDCQGRPRPLLPSPFRRLRRFPSIHRL